MQGPVPAAAVPVAQVRQRAEDFDVQPTTWQANQNRGVLANMDYGYSATNNVGAGLAGGEIGGQVSRSGISWYADEVANGTVKLNPAIDVLRAEGWARFTSTSGSVSVGWFNSDTYAAPDTAPDNFIGWRQNNSALVASLGTTGTSFNDSSTSISFANSTPFYWRLTYDPAGGTGYGVLTLVTGPGRNGPWSTASTRSLTAQEQTDISDPARQLNRFGIVTSSNGAQSSTVWLDNLSYTRVSEFPTMPAMMTRTQFFDSNPSDWAGVNNLVPHSPVSVTQDYKYQPSIGGSGYAGASGAGSVGGLLSQGIGISYYAYDYDPANSGANHRTFNDHLRSEGYIQFPSSTGFNSHLGWFNKEMVGWREANTLAFRFVREGVSPTATVNVSLDIATADYSGAGIGGVLSEGSSVLIDPPPAVGPGWHHYILDYDPSTPTGTITLEFDGQIIQANLPSTAKPRGADFDLFGLYNHKIPALGVPFTTYVDDLTNTTNGQPDPSTYYNGSSWYGNFSSDPAAHGWVGVNNSFTASDYVVRPKHEYGWTNTLPYLDGANGYSPMYNIDPADRHAAGGIVYLADFGMREYVSEDAWLNHRDDPAYYHDNPPQDVAYGYYGGNVTDGQGGRFDARNDAMVVTGQMKFDFAETDSAELIGWFDSDTAVAGGLGFDDTWQIVYKNPDTTKTTVRKGQTDPVGFLGLQINGGSANGYSLMPSYNCPNVGEDTEDSLNIQDRRIFSDGKWRDFYLAYDPNGGGPDPAGGTKALIILQMQDIDGTMQPAFTWAIPAAAKGSAEHPFSFDKFGIVTMRKGGGKPHAIFLDNLMYNDPSASAWAIGSLSAAVSSTSQINLSWSNISADKDGFKIERSTDGSNYLQIATVGPDSTSYSATGLASSTRYYFRVRAYSAIEGDGPYSAVASDKTFAGVGGWWKLDETSGTFVSDSSGNGANGTTVNGPIWVSGKSGNALSFDGVNDYVDLSAANSIIGTATTGSVSLWFKTGTNSTGAAQRLFYTSPSSGGTGDGGENRVQVSFLSDQRLQFFMYNRGVNDINLTTPSTYNDNAWHHVVATWQLNTSSVPGYATLYVDGVEIGSMVDVHRTFPTGPTVTRLGRPVDNMRYYSGLIDDVRLYNVAIEPSQVQALYFPRIHDGTAQGDTYYLKRNGPSLQLWIGSAGIGDPTYSADYSLIPSLSFNGNAGDDLLIIDASAGDPIPPGGINFDGGSGIDTWRFKGGAYTFAVDAGASAENLELTDNAEVVFNSDQTLNRLTITASRATLSDNGGRMIYLRSLDLGPAGSQTGVLDLNDNDLVVSYGTDSAAFAHIRELVLAGYRGSPDATATGIISSMGQSAGNTILALFDNALVGAPDWPPGSGHTIEANSVIGKYTFFGDMNLDGQVTQDDYALVDGGLGGVPPAGVAWISGDANLDGSVTADDYAILDAALGQGVEAPLSAEDGWMPVKAPAPFWQTAAPSRGASSAYVLGGSDPSQVDDAT